MLMNRGPRRRTLPRQRPAPEHNVIQAPELVRRLQQFLGMRQSHVAPTLSDGVQPVIILGDVSGRREIGGWVSMSGQTSLGNGALLFSTAELLNPSGSGVKMRVKQVSLTHGPTGGGVNGAWAMLVGPFAGGGGFSANLGAMEDGSLSPVSLPTWQPNDTRFWPKFLQPTGTMLVGNANVFDPSSRLIDQFFTIDSNPPQEIIRTYENLTLYPAQCLILQATTSIAAVGRFSVRMEWLEEPVTP